MNTCIICHTQTSNPKYCSIPCSAIGSSKNAALLKKEHITEYELSPSYCMECNIVLPYNKRSNKCCSKSCSISSSNRKRKQRKNCAVCGKKVLHRESIYCSNKCHNEKIFYEKTVSRVEKGEVSIRVTLRNYLRKIRGWRCEMCGLTEWLGKPAPLELDHINGNATNNFPDNIRLLCPNCHAMTPTANGKNKGNGRGSHGLSWHR